MPPEPADLDTQLGLLVGETPEQLFQRSIRERKALPVGERVLQASQLSEPEPKYDGAEMRAYDPDPIAEAYYKSVRENGAVPKPEGLATWRRLTKTQRQFDELTSELISPAARGPVVVGLLAILGGAKLVETARTLLRSGARPPSHQACATCTKPPKEVKLGADAPVGGDPARRG